MKFNYFFVPQGAKVIKENEEIKILFFTGPRENLQSNTTILPIKNTVVLDTGNLLEPGIIDHHQPNCGFENSCVATIVLNYPDRYLKHLRDQSEINIVTHFLPDLDALSSVFFTQKYLKGELITHTDKLMGDYINMVDLGKLVLDPENPVGIASLWLSFTAKIDFSKAFTQEYNIELLTRGLNFFESAIQVIEEQNANPWTTNGFEKIESLKDQILLIKDDAINYQHDFKKSKTGIIELRNKESGGLDEVELIISENTTSFLWKYWVRGDKKNSLYGKGFVLTCLHNTAKKGVIISVDPNSPYDLKGLGLYLDIWEIKKQIEKGQTFEQIIMGSDGGPRLGFHRNNPWYDGRGIHKYTIIDVPRGGTLLTINEINEAIFSYLLWNSFANLIIDKTKEIYTLQELESLNSIKNIIDKPYLVKNSQNEDLHSQIDEYQLRLCINQINLFLELDTHILFSEEHGDIIESIVQQKEDDLFLKDGDDIKKVLKLLFISSYTNIEFISKTKNWNKLLVNYISKGFVFFDTPAFEQKKNNLILKIEKYISPHFAYTLLDQTKDLPANSFACVFSKIESNLRNEDRIYTILKYQNSFSNAFSQDAIETNPSQNKHYSKITQEILNLTKLLFWDKNYFEEIPIYSYNGIKNYVDDLLHMLCIEKGLNTSKKDIFFFKQHDFKEIMSENLEEVKNNELEKLRSIFYACREELFTQLFEDNFSLLKNKKYEYISKIPSVQADVSDNVKQELIKNLIDLDFKVLSTSNYYCVKSKISQIEKLNFKLNDTDRILDSSFIHEIKLFEEMSSLEMLFIRLDRFSRLKEFNLIIDDNYLTSLNKLIYSLFRGITLYTNFNNLEELQCEIDNTQFILNELRMLSHEADKYEISSLREKLSLFMAGLVDEITLPVENLDQQISNGLDQYELLIGRNGIISEIQNLPLFYRQLFMDVFSGYKVYYKERISFLRNTIKGLLDESDSGDEAKLTQRYIETCNNLINDSVFFDWQELKNEVDKADKEILTNDFYKKYFHWLFLNKPEYNEILYQLNSEIRFAEGNSAASGRSIEDVEKIVRNLPYDSSQKITLYGLTVEFQLSKIIRHKPINLIHQSYDFLIEHFISKFHVDNVRESLSKFSTKFPWHYRFLTSKSNLRVIFLILCGSILLAGAFDSNLYSGKLAPLAHWMNVNIGGSTFTIISEFFSYFWGLILSLSFILPIYFLLKYIVDRYIRKKIEDDSDSHTKLNFFQLIQSIEGKRSHLLYIPFVIPLLIVVLQMSNPETIQLINKIEGFRFFSTVLLIIGLTILSVYNYVKEKNQKMSLKWLIKRTEHMLWLHLIQAFFISIFVIDLILRFQVSLSDFGENSNELFFLGISKYIIISRGPIDIVIMPTFTIMITLLTLFFSFFIEKIFGGNNE